MARPSTRALCSLATPLYPLFKNHIHNTQAISFSSDGPRVLTRPRCPFTELRVRGARGLKSRSEDLAPAASTTSVRAQRHMLAHPSTEASWSREHHASCGTRMRGPSGPRARASASSAALRSTRRASATFKRGAPLGPSRGDGHAGVFFLGGGFP